MSVPSRTGLTPPASLRPEHQLQQFSCGKPALDEWLRHRALKAEGCSARTNVSCLGETVVAYYCFAAGGVRIESLPKRLQRNMPSLVPVFLIGRLAVHSEYQGLGIGDGLLKDALSRAWRASQIIGARAVMVQAIDAEAAAFYAARGFIAFPGGSLTLFLPIETIGHALTSS